MAAGESSTSTCIANRANIIAENEHPSELRAINGIFVMKTSAIEELQKNKFY
jgi:hypothetical protein